MDPVAEITDIAVTTYQVTDLDNGVTYHFAVTAVDISGNEDTIVTDTNATPTMLSITPAELTAGIPWWAWLVGFSALVFGIGFFWLYFGHRKRPVPVELPAVPSGEEGITVGEEPESKVERRGCLFFWAPRRHFPPYRPPGYGPPGYRPPIYRPRTPRTPRAPKAEPKPPPPYTPEIPEGFVPGVVELPTPQVRVKYRKFSEKEKRLVALGLKIVKMESELKAKRRELAKLGTSKKLLVMTATLIGKPESVREEIEKLQEKIKHAEEWSGVKKIYEKAKEKLEAKEANYKKRLSDLDLAVKKSIDLEDEIEGKETELKNLKEEKKRLETEIKEEYKKRKQQKK